MPLQSILDQYFAARDVCRHECKQEEGSTTPSIKAEKVSEEEVSEEEVSEELDVKKESKEKDDDVDDKAFVGGGL